MLPVHTPHTCILPCKFGPALLFAMDLQDLHWVTLPAFLLAWQWLYVWPWPRDDDDLVRAFYSGLKSLTSKRISQLTPEDMAHLRAGAAKLTSQHFGVDECRLYRDCQEKSMYWSSLYSTTVFRALRLERGPVVEGLMEAFPGWREPILAALRLGCPLGPWPSVAHLRRSFRARCLLASKGLWNVWELGGPSQLSNQWLMGLYSTHVTGPVKVEAARLCRDIALLRKVVKEGSFEVVDEKSTKTPKAMKWVAIPGGVADAFWEWDSKSMKPVVEVIDLSMDID